MIKKHHILNGDALKKQFPKEIIGHIIIARFCLVDGNVKAKNLEELFKVRDEYLNNNYIDYVKNDYYLKSVPEINKIQNLSKNSEVYLWFEDDLFCQVNFWFVINLIVQNYKHQTVFLVRPKVNCEYSFGKMSEKELILSFKEKIEIEFSEMIELNKLWIYYQQGKYTKMLRIALELEYKFPFLIPVIEANNDRFPKNNDVGRPTKTLLNIINKLETIKFNSVFKEFCKKEAIYGFGDLQVKRKFDEIIKNYYKK